MAADDYSRHKALKLHHGTQLLELIPPEYSLKKLTKAISDKNEE